MMVWDRKRPGAGRRQGEDALNKLDLRTVHRPSPEIKTARRQHSTS